MQPITSGPAFASLGRAADPMVAGVRSASHPLSSVTVTVYMPAPAMIELSVLPVALLQTDAHGLPRLAADAWLRGRAVVAGSAHSQALQPVAEFHPSAGTRPLPPRAHWSPGAFQD